MRSPEFDREIRPYIVPLSTTSAVPQQPVPSLDATLRVIEPLAEWEFLPRDNRRTLLRQLCRVISVYQYEVKSVTLSLGAFEQPSGCYTGSHLRMAR